MSKQTYIDRQKEMCRAEWFKNHKADSPATGDIFNIVWENALLIRWRNPASWNYGCHFIIHRRWLCVVGDIGEATFEWSEDITLEFLAQIDFDYFLSKCRASPSGREFEQWDCDVAATLCAERIAELKTPEQPLKEGEEEILEAPESIELESLEQLGRADKDEYDRLAQEYYDATGDAEGASSFASYGTVPSVHAIGMFVGLQMAIEQLQKP